MRVDGVGIVTAGGRGIEQLDVALRRGWQKPECVDVPGIEHTVPAYRVDKSILKDKETLNGMRRADRLSRMATLAAVDAHEDAACGTADDRTRLGIVVATALGPHVRTFGFLDDILDYGDAAVSPTTFSHSVHNAAASYVATALDCHGPVVTLTDFDFAFHQALTTARCWLEGGRCDRVLVGAVDELGDVLLHSAGRLGNIPEDGRMRPFALDESPVCVPGEGAAFFLLSDSSWANSAEIKVETDVRSEVDLSILDAQGLAADESRYADLLDDAALVANYAPVAGSMMIGAAVQAAVAVLSHRTQQRYASPLSQDNPHGLNICDSTTRLDRPDVIQCLTVGRTGRVRNIVIG